MDGRTAPSRHGLALGVAAVAELLDRPAASLDELAGRLDVGPQALDAALRTRSVAPLIIRDADGGLRAVPGATSATLPRGRRRALTPRDRRR